MDLFDKNNEKVRRVTLEKGVEKMADLKRLFIGKPLKSAENDEHKLSRFAALALLSSDALSSIAYGTEQIVVVLVYFVGGCDLVFIANCCICYYFTYFFNIVVPTNYSCVSAWRRRIRC